MQREIVFDRLDAFTGELRNHGIDKIVFAEINEKRAVQVDHDNLELQDIRRLDLLAYKSPTIYKCSLDNVDLDEIYHSLTGEGFDVTRRSRNIT